MNSPNDETIEQDQSSRNRMDPSDLNKTNIGFIEERQEDGYTGIERRLKFK